MKSLLVPLVGLLVLSTLAHASDFAVNVGGKTASSEAIRVGSAWRTDLPNRYKVSLRSGRDISKKDLTFKVYFFDADGRIISQQSAPNAIWTSTKHGTDEVGMPSDLKAGQLATVYIAIPPEVSKSKTMLTIFGSGDDLAYDLHPNTKKLEELNFPEKDKLKK